MKQWKEGRVSGWDEGKLEGDGMGGMKIGKYER